MATNLFKWDVVGCIHLNSPVGTNLDIAYLYRLFASKYIIYLVSLFGSWDDRYLSLALLYPLKI